MNYSYNGNFNGKNGPKGFVEQKIRDWLYKKSQQPTLNLITDTVIFFFFLCVVFTILIMSFFFFF